jgi:hypothetical protein
MKKCPCEDCICVPICRNKGIKGISDCELVSGYVTKKIGEKSPPAKYFINRWNNVCKILDKPMYKFDPKYF